MDKKTVSKALTTTPKSDSDVLASVGFSSAESFVQTSTGEAAKWVDLVAFQVDTSIGRDKPVEANGNAFGGYLLTRDEYIDDEGEVMASYSIRLTCDCPITVKGDAGPVPGIAHAGEIVRLGERYSLQCLGTWLKENVDNVIVIQPTRRSVIGRRTLWNFKIWRNVMPKARLADAGA